MHFTGSGLVAIAHLNEFYFAFTATLAGIFHSTLRAVIGPHHIYLKHPAHTIMNIDGGPNGAGEVKNGEYGSEQFLHAIYSILFFG